METLAERTISGFPLSIGTSLAFESIFEPLLDPYDPKREIPNKVSIIDYQQIWINIYTLFRNLAGSIDKPLFIRTKPEEFAQVLYQEIEVIQSLLTNEGMNICKPIFYYASYNDVYSNQHKIVEIRKDTTTNQLLNVSKYQDTIKVFHKLYPDFLLQLDSKLKPDTAQKALLLSHIPYDLLSYKYFRELDLIESHTGVLKARKDWYTKYYVLPRADMSILPFNRKFLKIFGDHVMFSPMDHVLRRELINIGTYRQWTNMTTTAKIIQDLNISLKDRMLYDAILKI
jgi:hypothetical protein